MIASQILTQDVETILPDPSELVSLIEDAYTDLSSTCFTDLAIEWIGADCKFIGITVASNEFSEKFLHTVNALNWLAEKFPGSLAEVKYEGHQDRNQLTLEIPLEGYDKGFLSRMLQRLFAGTLSLYVDKAVVAENYSLSRTSLHVY